MKKLTIIVFVLLIFIPAINLAQEKVEQQIGDPLYLPPEMGQHKSDLAPDTDPYYEQEKQQYRQQGKSVDDMYDEPVETYYESKTYFKRVDK